MQPSIHSLNKELRLLVACCQAEPTEEDRVFIRAYLAQSDYSDTLIHLANQHGILPLVYKAIKNLLQNSPSLNAQRSTLLALNADTPVAKAQMGCNTFFSNLKSAYLQIAQRNMLMSAELLRIMKLLEENGIDALAFKGPSLSQMAYGDITLRQYVDLDILVDEDDAYRAGKLMSDHGYKPLLPLTILENKTCLHTAKDFSLMSDSGVHTELHWRLFEQKYNISLFSCAEEKRCQSVMINGKSIPTLENELLLVYLCLHGAKHSFERIEWICDIDRLIRNTEVDWKEAAAMANQSHSKRSFCLGLSLAYTLFDTPLPGWVLSEVVSEDIASLQTMTLRQMSEKENGRSDFQKNRETFFYQAKLFDQKSDRVRFYLSTLFTISTSDCQTFILPERLKFFYIVLRPIRLVWSYGKRVLRIG